MAQARRQRNALAPALSNPRSDVSSTPRITSRLNSQHLRVLPTLRAPSHAFDVALAGHGLKTQLDPLPDESIRKLSFLQKPYWALERASSHRGGLL
jgi:hypothetical protein